MVPEKREEYDPRFLESLRKTEQKGILIQELRVKDIILIETENSKYILKVLDPEKQKVEITKIKGKGKYFQKPTVTCVEGSGLTEIGTAIKPGWVAGGYRLELTSAKIILTVGKVILTVGNIVLTAAQRVFINGVQVFPFTDEKGN